MVKALEATTTTVAPLTRAGWKLLAFAMVAFSQDRPWQLLPPKASV
jgi:hypothetical protein